MIPLTVLETVIDASGVAPRIEVMLPVGVRPRQLAVRTLLAGMCLAQADHRPAHLTRVHQVLVSLPPDEQRRLGVITDWKHGPHQLTYRQTERTLCAARRFAVFPAQPGGTRREVPGSNGLPGSERLRGQQHARKPGGRVQWSGTARRGDPRDMAKAGLPESQSPVDASSRPPERPLKPVPRSASESKVADAPPERGATPSEGVEGDEWDA
jgi:hypothetical protein